MSAERRWRCPECKAVFPDSCFLKGKSPFDAREVLGCPECKAVVGVEPDATCDEPGCEDPVSCGWPGKDGVYRQTCSRHYR